MATTRRQALALAVAAAPATALGAAGPALADRQLGSPVPSAY